MLPAQDLNNEAQLDLRIEEAHQYADVLENQRKTYNDPKWINHILTSSHLNSAMCNICGYLAAVWRHEVHSSHTHPWNCKEQQSQSFTLFHHCLLLPVSFFFYYFSLFI